MKHITKLVAIGTLALGLGAICLAQDAGPTGSTVQATQKHEHMGGLKLIEKLQKDVLSGMTLTDDQKSKIDALNKSTEEQIKALKKSDKGSTDKSQIADQRKALMKSYSDSLKSIFTPDEFKTYHENMKAAMKAWRDQQKANNGGAGKP